MMKTDDASPNGDDAKTYTYQQGENDYEQYDSSAYDQSSESAVQKEQPRRYDSSTAVAERQQAQYQPDPESQALIEELKKELGTLDPEENKHAVRLINKEIERLSTLGEPELLEVDVPKPIKIVRKVMVPIARDPKFNFVGKLLGPGGKTLQNLISSTRCRIYILGRGSSREKAKEQELLDSGDPKYAHYKDPLFVRIESQGPAAIAYQKLAHVLHELQYYLQPVKDDIYLQQMADMGKSYESAWPPPVPTGMGGIRGQFVGAIPPHIRGGGPAGGVPRGGAPPPRARAYLMQTPPGPPPSSQAPPPSASGPPAQTYAYDYAGYEEYEQSATSTAQPSEASYGSSQAYSVGQMPPAGTPTRPPAPRAQMPPPQSTGYAAPASYTYDYPPPGPSTGLPGATASPRGGGKAPPPSVRGRGRGFFARPGPY